MLHTTSRFAACLIMALALGAHPGAADEVEEEFEIGGTFVGTRADS